MRALRLALLGPILLFACDAQADLMLRTPPTPVVAGTEFALILVETNPAGAPAATEAPRLLSVVAHSAGSAPVSAVFVAAAEADPAPLPARGFRDLPLRGRLPLGLTGLVVLDASSAGAGRIAIEVLPSENSGAPTLLAASNPNETAMAPHSPTPRAAQPLHRELGLSPHEPIYFSVGGAGGLNARFQFSFKFRPIGPSDDRIAGRGLWEDMYLAYTQTSLWDLHSLSKPFTDSSYRPAAFYHRNDLGFDLLGGRVGIAGGFEHESNGKGADDSRSINILFARPTLRWGDDDDWQLSLSPRLYWYLEKSENADITRFRGYGDFRIAIGHPRSWQLAAMARAGTSGRGSVLIDASYPFSKINDFFPLGFVHGYLHLQFFDGWGESLLHYDERAETQLRVGFMAVR